jgi:hypothetical protein
MTWLTHSYADVAAASWKRHGGGATSGSGNDGWESKWWLCGACSWYTPSQKGKCRHCGIKKQWGLTSSPSPAQSTPTTTTTTTTTPSTTPLQAQAQPSEPKSLNAQETSAQIKALEAALLLMPVGPLFESSRNGMRDHVAALKASISKSKPIGLRLESCRAAVNRAAKRKEAASEAVAAALMEEKTTSDELVKFSTDLAELEAELSASVGIPPQSGDCVTNMTCALERVVGEMRSSPLVPAALLYQAELQMTALLEGVKQISALALQAAQTIPATKVEETLPMDCFSSGTRPRTRKRASSAGCSANSVDHHPTHHRRQTGKREPCVPAKIPADLAATHEAYSKGDFGGGFQVPSLTAAKR